jgi:hypothetical protein
MSSPQINSWWFSKPHTTTSLLLEGSNFSGMNNIRETNPTSLLLPALEPVLSGSVAPVFTINNKLISKVYTRRRVGKKKVKEVTTI